ncbi:MAG: N-6 DNA methylase [Pseudanabaena sp. M165S2SP1A06QC]|nr:N-6 DNA methylase [Pseudanabaena sp. M165S2SP1A06QC]
MNTVTHDIVAKLWNLCNILKDDGVPYYQYVIELTYLLFLKMAKETQTEDRLPEGYRWDDLKGTDEADQLKFYKNLLSHIGSDGSPLAKEIFGDANSCIRKTENLSMLVKELDKLDWYSAKKEDLGDIYEGLIEKNANETKKAGQYFTPRSLIDSMVHLMRPSAEDVIQDPAAGVGGFVIAANRYIQEHSDTSRWTDRQKRKYRFNTFYGMEIAPDVHRLALMNLMLHGLDFNPEGAGIHCGNTLSPEGDILPKASLILTNPPFGIKTGGGIPNRLDFKFPTSNKQLCFLQHIYLGLKAGGRAAVVLPDNVLFENGVGKLIRTELMDKCNLHTILRLPSGIFYAQGVKTNVLFFTRGKKDKDNTKEVWVYDLRANTPSFGKRTSLMRSHFTDFEQAFGDDPLGGSVTLSKRVDTGEDGRFRRFSREWIAEHGDNLDISWLKDENADNNIDLPEPTILAQEAISELEAALGELREILKELRAEVFV